MPAKYTKATPALFLTDFYKICHRAFYHPDTQKLVSYWTPRQSRVANIDYVVMFWLQATIKKYLIDRFNETFFDRPWPEVRQEYVDYIAATFARDIAEEEIDAFKKIYDLGYLPIEIRAVPEGTRVPIGCPALEIQATEEFAFWLPQYLETILSCNLWLPMTDAAIADINRRDLANWYARTVDDNVPVRSGAGNFSMRGMPGDDAAIMADAAHLLSFASTATVPTAWALNCFYDAPFTVARGVPSTEHSIPESFGPERELDYYKRVLTLRPTGPISIVSDTWDLERVLTEFIPQLKDLIMSRDGRVLIRPDSGNPADIICGVEGKTEGAPLEVEGCIGLLWKAVGGRINSKGFKELDSHIGLIYGDAITNASLNEICRRLTDMGYAANNVVFGFGSYTYQYVTRDTFGFALKVTHGVVAGKERFMFKDPKTDKGAGSAGKKSQKGMCIVRYPLGGSGSYGGGPLTYTDQHTIAETFAPGNALRTVFRNGELLVDEDFETIRRRLHPDF